MVRSQMTGGSREKIIRRRESVIEDQHGFRGEIFMPGCVAVGVEIHRWATGVCGEPTPAAYLETPASLAVEDGANDTEEIFRRSHPRPRLFRLVSSRRPGPGNPPADRGIGGALLLHSPLNTLLAWLPPRILPPSRPPPSRSRPHICYPFLPPPSSSIPSWG